MTSRLITFLGKGNYEQTNYVFEGKKENTCYVARALATFLQSREVRVFATTEAWKKHGDSLAEAFTSSGLPQPRHIEICAGETPDELWQEFEWLLDALKCDGPVALDITHGFRAQPFFASAVIQFFQSIHPDCPSLKVFYGAFEAGDREAEETPIWDLTAFVELLRWSRGLLLFLRTGRMEDIAEPTERLGRDLQKQWALSDRQGVKPSLAALGKAIHEFGDDFVTIRTGALIGDRQSSSQRLYDALERAAADVEKYLPPLASVLQRVIDFVRPLVSSARLSEPAGQKALQALAKTYLSMGRYAEAAAILREGWITRYAGPQADQPGSACFSMPDREAAEERWGDHDVHLAQELGDLRNDIEHAGFRRDPRPPQGIKQQLDRMIEQWGTLSEVAFQQDKCATGTRCRPDDVIFYSIGIERPILPDEPLPPLPQIPRGALVVIEGRAPIWRYGMALHRLHGSPAAAIAVFDPRLGAVVVASHHPDWSEGQVLDVDPPSPA